MVPAKKPFRLEFVVHVSMALKRTVGIENFILPCIWLSKQTKIYLFQRHILPLPFLGKNLLYDIPWKKYFLLLQEALDAYISTKILFCLSVISVTTICEN